MSGISGMGLRLYVGPAGLALLGPDSDFSLPPGATRHAQVRRVQPGDTLWLFDGAGRDWPATVQAMGRNAVQVRLGEPVEVARELPWAVTLAVGMPANERMDTLVEKATELGVAAIQPLLCERAVLRLAGERAERKQAHWQAVAEAACEQCGRAVVPAVMPVRTLSAWLHALAAPATAANAGAPLRLLLSPDPSATPLSAHLFMLAPSLFPSLPPSLPQSPAVAVAAAAAAAEAGGPPWHTLISLSGPEGGLSPAEEAAARQAGFLPTGLGPRVLRADTAPLALLAAVGLLAHA